MKKEKPLLILDEYNHTENDIKNGYTKPGWYFVGCRYKLYGPFSMKFISAFENWKEKIYERKVFDFKTMFFE